jgi:hypothetical protein
MEREALKAMQSRVLQLVRFQLALPIGMLASALLLAGCSGGSSNKTATPEVFPAGGTYAYIPTLTIQDATSGASIYYTTDGSTPSAASTLYSTTTPVEVSQSETVKVIAIAGSSPSAVASASYTINLPPAPTPVLSPAVGPYIGVQTVTATDTAVGATMYYTTDGTTPTSSSTPYTGPISVTNSETLQVVAISQSYGYSYSAVAGGVYAILVTPAFSVSSGAYATAQTLTLSVPTPGASIYYTTNGTAPTTSSTLYTGPITVASSEIVTAVATVGALTSTAVTNTYLIQLPGVTVVSGAAIGGKPVVGATVQLYQVGATGYGSAATPLMSSAPVTNSTGSVTLAGSYTCTHGTYLYLTASGGTTATGQAANPNLTLAAAVGLCDNLTANSSFLLNEQTTVAAAYALAHFASGTTFGTTQVSKPGSGSSAPADNFATSSTNIVGIANAMAIAQILASNNTGATGNNVSNTATPEWWQVNLISDMLAACNQSVGSSSTPCATLFGNVGGTTPGDTFQAALDLALTPTLSSTHIGSLYGLVSSSSPFLPYPPSASSVYDFSIAISYTPAAASGTKLLTQPQGVAIDSLGNAWVGSQASTTPYLASLVELTPTGIGIQAGATPGNYAINAYALSSTPTVSTVIGGQYIASATTPVTYSAAGLFTPSIDTSNNVWITDRQKSNMAMLTGSGTTYSSSYSYQNGGNALDSGGKGAVGYALNASSYPTSVYLDGSNNVWFMMEGTVANGSCATLGTSLTSYSTAYNDGIAAFLGENPSNVVTGKNGNTISTKNAAYLTVDPGKNDTVTISASPQQISGSPFVWFAGVNAGVNLLIPNFTQAAGTATPNGGVPYPSCETNAGGIGEADDTAAAETYWTLPATPGEAASGESGHAQSWVYDTPDPNLSGDFLHDIGMIEDQTWDNAGHLWVANGNVSSFIPSGTIPDSTPINTIGTTTPASQINAAISKITTNWGTGSQGTSGTTTIYTPTTSGPFNFTYSVFHNQSGLFDGSTVTNVPEYITTDGGGNVYFATSTDNYVNAITNSGTALTQVSGTATSPMTGFIGSICTSCTNNGTTATYQRANSYTLSRPAIDQAGNIWIPLQGSGSNSLYLLVGAAVPRVQPDSVGLKTGTFAEKP